MDDFRSKVFKLRNKTGDRLWRCKEAMEIFNGDIEKAIEYLKLTGLGTRMKKKDGGRYTKQDYIGYVNLNSQTERGE